MSLAVKKIETMFTRHVIILVAMLLVGVAYASLLVPRSKLDLPPERIFDLAGASGFRIYVEPTAIDPMRDAMQVRVSIEGKVARASLQPVLPEQDFDLVVTHDSEIERVRVHAHQPFPTVTVELDLYDGDIASYPFDRYRAVIGLAVVPLTQTGAPEMTPVNVTIWQRVLGFRLETSVVSGVEGGAQANFQLSRSGAAFYFALAIYGAMVVLGCSAISMGVLTFLGIRRIDVSVISALGAMVFALPALRNALPGSPPLGVLGDVLVFIWAELAAVLSLALVVETWCRSGPRPDR